MTKRFGTPLVVSAATADEADADLSPFASHDVQIRGRDGTIRIYAVDDPSRWHLETP